MTAAHTSELAAALAEPLPERSQRYVRIDTEARPDRERCPSSPGQLGLADAEQDANGYVFATLPSTNGENAPVIGLLAHLDTSPDAVHDRLDPVAADTTKASASTRPIAERR